MIQGDITTEKCRQSLRKELQTWKADAVIHDGAPNVGTTWVLDAFQQAQLTLVSVKLACEFLNKGGWFVTKVFRSKDYQVLLWVFNQLFKKVHATKPQASRNESAEIFVVCQGYLAPDKIDTKFFDPKYIFKEVDLDGPKKMTIFQDPSKQKKAKAIGYAEGDYLQHTVVKATDYLASETPAEVLNDCSEIVIDDDEIAKNPLTTVELKHCIKDIKVLGKKEIKLLLTWHKKLNKQRKKEEAKLEPKKEVESSDSEDEEAKIERQLEKLKDEETAAARRKKKDLLKKRRKLRERLNKALDADIHGGPIEDGESMFELRRIKNKKQLQQLDKGEGDEAEEEVAAESDSEDSDSDLPSELDEDEAEMLRQDKAKYAQVEGGDDEEDDDIGYPHSDEEEDQNSAEQNPLMVELDDEDQDVKAQRRTNLWFSKAAFSGLDDDMDEDLEVAQMTKSYKARGGQVIENKDDSKSKKRSVRFDTSVTSLNMEGEEDVEDLASPSDDEEESDDGLGSSDDEKGAQNGAKQVSDSDSDDSDSDYDDEVMLEGYAKANEIEEEEEEDDLRTIKTTKELKKKRKDGKSRQEAKDGFEIVPAEEPAKKMKRLDPEGLAIGTLMATSKKKRREILEHSYHRFTNGEEDTLPKWFMEDEIQHRRKQMPVTKELVAEYKARLTEINARPIKKVAEAKARKKMRTNRKMEKLKKKAAAITDTVDMSDREKMQNLKNLYKKAGIKKQQKKVTYVVSKKALAGKRMQRPRGLKGPYKVVDPRLKKDMRAKKRVDAKNSKKRKRKH
ncbi:pre-rRNA 2'-O-ribose RNA methyltransferase FTSJ3-like isoform X2 [Amphiura filiformis]|uniref:pre-rRNA 2'-O-ribose RNA methyltransferase FTSJ3-like isoform X2 n=1 Tax=Amphiura filiformis TaxID=82378 RepID=UPI003B219DB5